MSLLTLPNETLTQIASLLEEKVYPYLRDVRSLALVSTRLGHACDPTLWRKYRFIIRSSSWGHFHGMNYSESNISKEDWLSRFDKRIEHLLAKSSYVRDLKIVDDTRSFATAVHGPLAFTPEFLDRAMPAIRACTGVTKLCLWDGAHKEGALWPVPIWNLVQNAWPVLEELCLCANFVDIPKLEGPPFALAALTLRWCASLIDVFLPQEDVGRAQCGAIGEGREN
ncbi:hypothetical protein EXIGLDRAFT_748880 [Exidia glandulosa HHB12029]|uniref:F-box domain-containing protein n=1 Tax=Exidia glandulosa HHB12029 TaxID=1314781 RepID=A0A165IV16_EXIGL|nr:hypothetical protein EXIGLDRAFT_748880 [Exidia glandulosa HHB12029]